MISRLLGTKNGLTLIEVIISMSILSLILIIVLGALRLGFRFWERGEEVSLEAQEQRMVWSALKHQLCSIYPYRARAENKDLLVFQGEEHGLECVSLFSYYLQDKGGLRYCRYKIEKDENGKGLCLKVFEAQAVNADLGLLEVEDERFRVLVGGLPPVMFQYAGQKGPDEPLEWVSTWNGKEEKRLPVAIKLAFGEHYHHMKELTFLIRSKGYDVAL
jgi:general secretion pathway protein J